MYANKALYLRILKVKDQEGNEGTLYITKTVKRNKAGLLLIPSGEMYQLRRNRKFVNNEINKL